MCVRKPLGSLGNPRVISPFHVSLMWGIVRSLEFSSNIVYRHLLPATVSVAKDLREFKGYQQRCEEQKEHWRYFQTSFEFSHVLKKSLQQHPIKRPWKRQPEGLVTSDRSSPVTGELLAGIVRRTASETVEFRVVRLQRRLQR